MADFFWYKHLAFICSVLVVGNCIPSKGQEKQLLTPQDCTGITYLENDDLSRHPSVQESPDGKTISYIVQVPDIAKNDNEMALYIQGIDGRHDQNRAPILTSSRIAGVHWFPDSRHLAALVERSGKSVLVQFDTTTATLETIGDPTQDIGDYSMDRNGDVFAVSVKVNAQHSSNATTPIALEKGYRVVPAPAGYAEPPRLREIYILRRTSTYQWEESDRLTFTSPLSGETFSVLRVGGGMDISLSPNGRSLLVDNIEPSDRLPGRWQNSPYVSFLRDRFGFVLVNYLYDLSTRRVSLPFDSPLVRQHAEWSPDSHSFARVALPPVGSIWEQRDMAKGVANDHDTHLFTVDITTGTVNQVLERAEREPLLWAQSGDLLTRDQEGSIRSLKLGDGRWVERASFRIPLPGLSPSSAMTTDGNRFVGDYQDASTAPQLFEYNANTAKIRVIVNLNPQVDALILPQVMRIQWETSTGYQASGVLLLPPNYDPTRRYPLVIENGSLLYNGEFVCDSGVNHVSSFVRGMLADEGVLYLMRSWPVNDSWEHNFYPKGYPGGIAEVAFKMDLVESAVRYLDSRKMVDLNNVGIIGFSRGGWYTEYALAHSRLTFRAATVTDNVEYSYGAYWYFHSNSMQHSYDAMYGGPPYGKTMQNWRDYSISFNTEKIHTPLLTEVMGYGLKDDDPQRPPNNLAVYFELFTALNRLNRPVEMYYYPNEQHQVEHPVARIASLQRNIDWFRFWLQGYERPDAEDRDQYVRWRNMREHGHTQ